MAMDERKLARLRKLGERGTFEPRDPTLRTMMQTLKGEMPEPYAGISTFLDAPHRENGAPPRPDPSRPPGREPRRELSGDRDCDGTPRRAG